MNVRLVSYSQPTDGFRNMGISDAQELIAYCARVSNPANQLNTETSEKLIRYLVKHQHWSPLEMVSVCCEITTTRDIARQILRHRSFSFQEFSQRYADPTQELDFVLREARLQDTSNRQNSIEVEDNLLQIEWERAQKRVLFAVRDAYAWAIKNGIAATESLVQLSYAASERTSFLIKAIDSALSTISRAIVTLQSSAEEFGLERPGDLLVVIQSLEDAAEKISQNPLEEEVSVVLVNDFKLQSEKLLAAVKAGVEGAPDEIRQTVVDMTVAAAKECTELLMALKQDTLNSSKDSRGGVAAQFSDLVEPAREPKRCCD